MSSLKIPIDLFKRFLNKGHARSANIKTNIIASLFIRGGSIAISLLLIPLTFRYVNASEYGIWLTLSSIITWFSFFDIGLTQGLRNKFAEAITKGDEINAKIYVSSAYAILTIIFLSIWLIFIVINPFLNWSNILNLSQEIRSDTSILAIIVFTYFCLQFVLRIITTIIIADQQPAKSSLIDLLGQILSLLVVYILVETTKGSLLYLGIGLCVSPLLVLLVANILLFNGKYKKYRPEFSKINFSRSKELFNLGFVFFVIQLAGIIQYETANIIIARNYSTADVTSYNIAYKYFGVLNMVFSIFLIPFWSASTEAYLKNDIQWIKAAINKYNYLNIVLIGVGIVMLVFSQDIYTLWLGEDKVNIDFALSLWSFLFFNLSMFGGKYVSFLNGINALRIQFISSLLSPIIYLIVVFTLLKYFDFGVYILFVAAIVANFNGYLLAPVQYYMITAKNKKGIWIQ